MNTVYFVRHGENPANITREFSCKVVDYPLTPKGEQQAWKTARHLKDKHIMAVYASPLKRAAQTGEIIAAELGLPMIILEAFREVNVGALELQPPTEETWTLHDRIFDEWLAGNAKMCFPDGENYTTLLSRMRAGLSAALDGRDGERIVIAAHGGILAATICDLCANVRASDLGQIPNCAITCMRLDAREGIVRGTLEAWAACDHLS